MLEAYAYDSTGNRTSATVGGTTTAYSHAGTSHRLNAVGTTARSYDAAGNTTQIGANKSFVYDDLGRMRQVLDNGVVTRNYAYNGLGQQVRTWAAANDDRYHIYGKGSQLLGEYDTNGAPRQQIVWFNGLPVAVLTDSGTNQTLHYIEADALGTPRVIVDPTRGPSGTAIWRWDLTGEAFGNTPPDEDPDGDGTPFVFDMRFPGQRFDSASGLNYNYFRDYDASTGRYVESDPIGLAGGISTYGYVGGNPMVGIDSLGLSPVDTTYTAWCRQNPGHCVGIAGTAGVIAAISIQSSMIYGASIGSIGSSFSRTRPWQANSNEGGRAKTPAPYDHFEENEALNFTPDTFGGKEQCELLAYMIRVLRAQITWRKTDLNPNSTSYRDRLSRIAILSAALVKLEASYLNICGGNCPA